MLNRLLKAKSQLVEGLASWIGDETPNGVASRPIKSAIHEMFDKHFISSILPYDIFDPETSLFINKKSMGFILEAATLLGSSEETENILASVITDIIPADVDIQFLLWASPKIGNILDSFENERSKNEIFSWVAKKRTDYLKKGAYEGLSGFGTPMLRNLRLYIVISQPKTKDNGVGEMISYREDLQSSLKSINMNTRTLDAKDFISIFSDIITPTQDIYPNDLQWNELDSLSLQVTNSEWKMSIEPNSIRFLSESDEIEARCLTVKQFPEKPTQWRVTENLGQLFNDTLQIPCPFLISFSVRKMNQDKSLAKSQAQNMSRKSTANSKLAQFKPSVAKEYKDAEFFRTRLADGDSSVKTFYQIILFSKPEKANACERRVRDLYRANGWKLRKETFLQMQSWLAVLPMMLTEGLYDDLKHFGRLRTMTGFNAINIAPLQGEWKGTQTPSLILPGRRGQIATWNPFDNEGNYNIAIMAAPGKGKSVFTNEYIVSVLGAGGKVRAIDAGRSYQNSCKIYKGEFIEFTHETNICLNPFTNITDITESMIMLKPLLAVMARPITGASEEELAYIEQGIKAAWEREGTETTISSISNWLGEHTNSICKNLSHLLYSYTKDGIYSKYFEGRCTVDFSNPFIVLELQELKAKKDLMRIVLQLLIYLISQEMYLSDRDQIKSCVIDEAWDLFDSDNIATAKFIEAGYRTARKFKGNFISIAHSASDFHKTQMARAAFDCADFKIFLGQTDEAINKMKMDKIMDIDGMKERLFKSLKITKQYSECIISSPEGLSVHRIILDPYSRILFSTKGEEFAAVNRLLNQNVGIKEAIEQIVRESNHV